MHIARKHRFCHCEQLDAVKQSLPTFGNEIASAKDASEQSPPLGQ